jgi:hypothetical protein
MAWLGSLLLLGRINNGKAEEMSRFWFLFSLDGSLVSSVILIIILFFLPFYISFFLSSSSSSL